MNTSIVIRAPSVSIRQNQPVSSAQTSPPASYKNQPIPKSDTSPGAAVGLQRIGPHSTLFDTIRHNRRSWRDSQTNKTHLGGRLAPPASDVLITVGQNIPDQQNLAGWNISLVILCGPTNLLHHKPARFRGRFHDDGMPDAGRFR